MCFTGKMYKSALNVNLFNFTGKVTILSNIISDPSAKVHVLCSSLTCISVVLRILLYKSLLIALTELPVSIIELIE